MILFVFYLLLLGFNILSPMPRLLPLIFLGVLSKNTTVKVYRIQILLLGILILNNMIISHGLFQNLEAVVSISSFSIIGPYINKISEKRLILNFNMLTFFILFIYLLGFIFSDSRAFAFSVINIGSHNAHAFFILIFFSFINKPKIQNVLLLSIAFLLIGGRTNVIIGFLAPLLYLLENKINIYTIICFTLFSYLIVNNLDYIVSVFSSFDPDWESKKFTLGPRELIYNCIYDNTKLENYLFGSDLNYIYSPCFETYIGNKVESSLVTLISHMGLFSIFVLYILAKSWKESKRLWIFIIYLIRFLTGEFFFFGIFDAFLFLPLLKRDNNRKIIQFST